MQPSGFSINIVSEAVAVVLVGSGLLNAEPVAVHGVDSDIWSSAMELGNWL